MRKERLNIKMIQKREKTKNSSKSTQKLVIKDKEELSNIQVEENKSDNSNFDVNKFLKKDEKSKRKFKWLWPIKVFIITIIIAFTMSIASEFLLSVTGIILSVILLIVFISIAMVFDMLGVASTSANIEPFLSMASRRIRGSKESIKIVRNAEKFSSFSCDIIGDMCGIICGSIGASFVARIALTGNVSQIVLSAIVSGIIAGLTVFLKAIGKNLAINKANNIVFALGKFLSIFDFHKNSK